MNTSQDQPSSMGQEAPQTATPPPGVPPAPGAPPPYTAPPASPWNQNWASGRKSAVLAAVLSGVFPGVGQVYLGYYQRGFLHAFVFAGIIAVLASGDARGLEPLFGMSIAFWYIYTIVDAARRASLYNQALDGMSPMPVPEDFKMPGSRPSLFAGLVITVLGLVFLLHTRFDFSLDWLADWWPAILVIIGLHMVWKAMREKSA
jgi:TM2 domain-containing membrane protein YozV